MLSLYVFLCPRLAPGLHLSPLACLSLLFKASAMTLSLILYVIIHQKMTRIILLPQTRGSVTTPSTPNLMLTQDVSTIFPLHSQPTMAGQNGHYPLMSYLGSDVIEPRAP